jgi:hypothetical protein
VYIASHDERKLVDCGENILELQKEIWRKPTRKVLMAFIIAGVQFFALLPSFLLGLLTGRPVLFVKLPGITRFVVWWFDVLYIGLP